MYSSILVAVDLDQPASWAKSLPVGVEMSRIFGARLSLCTVVTNAESRLEAQWSPIAFRREIETARARLATLADRQNVPVTTDVASGSIWRGILDVAERVAADLIVLASHKAELKDYLLGANASRVVRHSDCSVLVVRGAPV